MQIFFSFDANALFGTKSKYVCFASTFLFLCCAFSTEVPHFRYTDGNTYLKEASSPERTGR